MLFNFTQQLNCEYEHTHFNRWINIPHSNPNQIFYNEVNLDQLSQAFKANEEVTPEALEKAHLLRDSRNPTVVLGRGEISVALKIRVHRISAGAKAKIEKAGGTVEVIA